MSAEQGVRRTPLDRWAWAVWGAFALLVVLQKYGVPPSPQNVFTIYREAALRWQNGQDLYPFELLFNYFPQAALLFVPLTPLPFEVGGAIWRAANIFVFAFGLWRLSGLGSPGAAVQSRFWVASWLTLLVSLSAARYAQITLTMAGLMMLAAVEAERGRAWSAAVFAALAVAVKPPAIALMLVLVALYPRIGWRCGAALLVLAILPFAFQDFDYVLRQYAAVPAMLENRAVDRDAWVFHGLFELLRTLGWATTDLQQTIVRAVGAVAVLVLCFAARRQSSRFGVAASLYAFVACYILLLGYGTERNAYAMLGPAIGLAAVHAWGTKDRVAQTTVVAVAVAMTFSYTLARAFPDTPLAMLKVVACLVLLAWMSSSLLAAQRFDRAAVPGWEPPWRAGT